MATSHKSLIEALPRLARYALSLTREPDAARDLVQLTAVRALAADEAPSGSRATIAWLMRIARNVFIDERRHAIRTTPVPLDADFPAHAADPVRVIAVRQALARLDANCRAIVVLVDMHGLSYKEAAERLDVPIGTVMSRLSRARSQLVVVLAVDEGDRS